jgi:hypothetical protein
VLLLSYALMMLMRVMSDQESKGAAGAESGGGLQDVVEGAGKSHV